MLPSVTRFEDVFPNYDGACDSLPESVAEDSLCIRSMSAPASLPCLEWESDGEGLAYLSLPGANRCLDKLKISTFDYSSLTG